MMAIVGTMLVMMRTRHRLFRAEAVVLLALYLVYLGLMFRLFL